MVEVTEYDMTEFVSISDKGFQSLWPSIITKWYIHKHIFEKKK